MSHFVFILKFNVVDTLEIFCRGLKCQSRGHLNPNLVLH